MSEVKSFVAEAVEQMREYPGSSDCPSPSTEFRRGFDNAVDLLVFLERLERALGVVDRKHPDGATVQRLRKRYYALEGVHGEFNPLSVLTENQIDVAEISAREIREWFEANQDKCCQIKISNSRGSMVVDDYSVLPNTILSLCGHNRKMLDALKDAAVTIAMLKKEKYERVVYGDSWEMDGWHFVAAEVEEAAENLVKMGLWESRECDDAQRLDKWRAVLADVRQRTLRCKFLEDAINNSRVKEYQLKPTREKERA